MHVSTMHIYMIFDPDACVYDADMNDAYIHELDASVCDAYIFDP